MENRKEVGILGANILYLITAILLLTIGYYVQHKDVESGLIITEYILILLPPLIYVRLKGDNFKRVFRLNKLKLKHGLLIIGITILSYPIALFFNLVIMTFISTLGNIEPPPIPTAKNISEYFVLMIIISMSAGICEEFFFRGLILRSYERMGQINAIVISSFLFGLFHFNIQNFLGPVILGLIFGYLVYRTDSLFAGIIGHMTNNGVAVTLGFLINLINRKLPKQDISTNMPNTLQLIMATVFVGFIATITGVGAYLLLRIIIKDTKKRRYMEVENIEKIKKMSLFVFTPILLTGIIFIYVVYLQLNSIMH
ncbi:CPBP family intramembrane metalloprotease [Crassaminicella thermophila]|uniref:CPBP family intramembrane metalloprotease n=1 Tax=Crassaminicella thermophila TaxID=2599308 RepID=A0A5C0SGJ9_CRATE|nr:type II CAAX endopeptidase family protein [Crassaminicella thermophila]QEK12524.1 CPBP family intramembrane metalloprotease [Crassaminicella thermophila]